MALGLPELIQQMATLRLFLFQYKLYVRVTSVTCGGPLSNKIYVSESLQMSYFYENLWYGWYGMDSLKVRCTFVDKW